MTDFLTFWSYLSCYLIFVVVIFLLSGRHLELLFSKIPISISISDIIFSFQKFGKRIVLYYFLNILVYNFSSFYGNKYNIHYGSNLSFLLSLSVCMRTFSSFFIIFPPTSFSWFLHDFSVLMLWVCFKYAMALNCLFLFKNKMSENYLEGGFFNAWIHCSMIQLRELLLLFS